MFIINLIFSDNKPNAKQFMQGHNEWLEQNFEQGVFIASGSLQPNLGGGILAHNCTLAALETRVNADPFVANNVVKAQITELSLSKTNKDLAFLLPNA